MGIVFKHTWILFIAVTIANGVILKYRAKPYIIKNPTLKTGYDNYVKGFIAFLSIPWIIMAIGDVSGLTTSTFDYFNPRSMNPIVLFFHASIILLWVLLARWIYFKKGAEFIEEHPGLFNKSSFNATSQPTAKQVKIFFPLALLGGIAALAMMWFNHFPVHRF